MLSLVRPRWAVIENVHGLLSSNEGRDFGRIIDALDELGFDASWAVLDAQWFGVAQRRRRVFIVAGPRGLAAQHVLAVCEGCEGHPPPLREARQNTTRTLTVSSLKGGGPSAGKTPGGGYLEDVAGALVASAGRSTTSGDQTFIPDTAPTITGASQSRSPLNGADGRVAVPGGVRRLTPRECERLSGWPDDHTRWTPDGREIADSHRYRMTGNAVVAPVAEWIGRQLMAVDAAMFGGEA